MRRGGIGGDAGWDCNLRRRREDLECSVGVGGDGSEVGNNCGDGMGGGGD